jgi:D-serine deaminase-like pyridoxal phosphate-dependent protein
MQDWYKISNINELDSPCLAIFPDRVKQNIHTAIQMIGDVSRFRPHVKTNKSPDATKLLIAAGVTKFKCATIAEAEMLGYCGAKDVLVAYQPVGPKINRLVSVIQQYPSTLYSCLIDNMTAAKSMAEIFLANGLEVPVFVDLNLGQNRTGIPPGQEAVQLYVNASLLKGIKPVGLHAYDGHIRDVDFDLRKQECDRCFTQVIKTKDDIMQSGLGQAIIIAGGSPTFSIHCQRNNCECSPGTFIYWDKGYSDLCPEQNFIVAAVVVTRIISFPDKAKICVDLGHKSIAAENDITKRVYFINGPELKALSQSEEHLVLETAEDHEYQLGEVFYGIPMHICPTIALYEFAYIIIDHVAVGEWKNIARDRRINL